MNNNIDYLKSLLEKKEQAIATDLDRKKADIIRKLLNDSRSFFELDMETSIEILSYLGVPADKIKDVYFELISPEAFLELPKIRITGNE